MFGSVSIICISFTFGVTVLSINDPFISTLTAGFGSGRPRTVIEYVFADVALPTRTVAKMLKV